jgi:hypothetical protein
MIQFFARIWAKHSYVFQLESEASKNLINAGLAEKRAGEKRAYADQLEKEAVQIEKRIAHVVELEEKGYWLCENGHEHTIYCGCARPGDVAVVHGDGCLLTPPVRCSECGKSMKLVKRSEMTGQEKYESDKERKEAEKVIEDKRAIAKQESETAKGGEDAAKVFRQNAENARMVADKIRAL